MARHTKHVRQRSVRTLASILVIAVASLLLSACVDVEIGSEYRLDGSATHSIQIVMPLPVDEGVDPDAVTRFLEDLEQQASEAGFEFARIEQQDSITARVTATTSASEDAGASINGLINATGLNASPGVTAPFRGTFAQETGAVGGTGYTLDLSVDGQLLFESVQVNGQENQTTALRDALEVSYVATLPGDITGTTGDKINDSTVRWDIPPAGEIQLLATSSTGGSGSAALFVIAGLIAFGAVILIALALGWYFAGRDRLANALGGALHRLPGQRTITTEGAWVARKIGAVTHRLSRSKDSGSKDKR